VTVIQGVIFVSCVLTFRRGVVGEIAHFFRVRCKPGGFPANFAAHKAVDDPFPRPVVARFPHRWAMTVL